MPDNAGKAHSMIREIRTPGYREAVSGGGGLGLFDSRVDDPAPPGREEDHRNGPEVANGEFGGFRFGSEEVVRFYREVVVGVVADAEGDVAGEEMVGIPGMFRAG